MANHVNNYLDIRTVSEEGKKVWQTFVGKMQNPEQSHFDLRELFFDGVDSDGTFINYDWSVVEEYVGAKWATVEDVHEDGLNVCSAWGPVIPFANHVAQEIGKVDPNVQLVMTYEDEFPNFIGVVTFNKDGVDTDNELEIDDLHELCRNQNSELAALWDEDTQEWADEDAAYELLWEDMWDVANNWQMENIEWSNS